MNEWSTLKHVNLLPSKEQKSTNTLFILFYEIVIIYFSVGYPAFCKRVSKFAWNLKTMCPNCSLKIYLHAHDR